MISLILKLLAIDNKALWIIQDGVAVISDYFERVH